MIWKPMNSGSDEIGDILRYTNKSTKTTYIISALKKANQYIVYCHKGFVYGDNSYTVFCLNLRDNYDVMNRNNEVVPHIPILENREVYSPTHDKFIVYNPNSKNDYLDYSKSYTKEEFVEYKTLSLLKNHNWDRFYSMTMKQNRKYLVNIISEYIINAIKNDVRELVTKVLNDYILKVNMNVTKKAFEENNVAI